MIADDAPAGTDRSGARRIAAIVVGAVLVLVAVGVWAATPFDDHVPLVLPDGVEVPAPDELPEAARFECSGLLSSAKEPEPSNEAVEALDVQELERTPCDSIQDQRRILLGADIALVLAALAGWAWYRSRRVSTLVA